MSAVIMEGQLASRLRSDSVLSQRGCTAARAATGGVTIERRGHHLGVWHWRQGIFAYTPAGYGEPTVEVETVAEAVRYTRERVTTG
jgi:hypothetical protein